MPGIEAILQAVHLSDAAKVLSGGGEVHPEGGDEGAAMTPAELAIMHRAFKAMMAEEKVADVGWNLGEFLAGIYSSMHVIDVRDRLHLYDLVPDFMLTAHTSRIKRIGELWDYFMDLKPVDFERQPQQIKSRAELLEKLSRRIADVYTENDFLPNFAVNRLIRAAYAGEDITAVRFDWDISRLNAMDETGTLADEFIPEVGDWLRTKIVDDPGVRELFAGDPPVAIRLPERTSFAMFGSNSEKGARLVNFLIGRMGTFEEDMQRAMIAHQREGWISPDVDLDSFSPRATIHHTTIRLKDFMHEYARANGYESIEDVPRHIVVEHALSELRRLAAQTTFLKAYSPAYAVRIGGLFVYDDDALPKADPADVAYESLKYFIDNGRGSIPFGRFGYQDEADPETRAMLEHPEVAENMTYLSGQMGGGKGGAMEHFNFWISAFLANPKFARRPQAFGLFKREVENLARLVLNLGEEGRREYRYPSMMKSTRRISGEGADFFMEQVGMMNNLVDSMGQSGVKYDILAMVEVDDGRAFGMSYPTVDGVDGKFQIIKKLIFDTAVEMGMFPPVIAAEGDQIRLAIPSMKMDGSRIEPEDFLGRYQKNVRGWYEERKFYFQPFAKVKEGQRVDRIPVWMNGEGGFRVSEEIPEGFEPFRKVVTVTVAWTWMPDMSTAEGARQANERVRLGFKYIDKVGKTQKGPFVKEGLVRLPDDYRNGRTFHPGQGTGNPVPSSMGGGGSGGFLPGPCNRFPTADATSFMLGSQQTFVGAASMPFARPPMVGIFPNISFSPMGVLLR